ncbi:uncharacterized protein LOC133917278 [Phragmites australis]|uniref:uncharacterized protein LOC133917278 n=1 Tax=Phragmites australis TaxID=29695 RepID=UPI002D7826C4|nr:uncharacterized protein LOC133917278 [Phragmites australis]
MGSLWCRRRVYMKGTAGWQPLGRSLGAIPLDVGHDLKDVIEEPHPFAVLSFEEYLRWYVPRTRTWVTYTPNIIRQHVTSTTEAYPGHWDEDAALEADIIYDIHREVAGTMDSLRQGVQLSMADVVGFVKRVFNKTARALKLTSCRSTADVAGAPARSSGVHAESSRRSDVQRRPPGPTSTLPPGPRPPCPDTTGYYDDEAGLSTSAPRPFAHPPFGAPPFAPYYGTHAWPSTAAPAYHTCPSSEYTWTTAEPSQSSYPSQEDEPRLDPLFNLVRDFFGATSDYDVVV